MASEITLNGLSEPRPCPVCGTMAKVSHGIDAAHPMHYWECPECRDSIAIVCYHCESCGQKVIEVVQ